MKRYLPILALAAIASTAVADPRIAPSPALPMYGQEVVVEVKDATYPMYLPATRFTKSGSTITIDYEYLTDGFGPMRPDFGASAINFGELAPGNYEVQARLHDINRPQAEPTTLNGTIAVVPPSEYGVYLVPRQPQAFAPAEVMVRGAVYFDPTSMRATVSGNVIRVDLDFEGKAGAVRAGWAKFASLRLPNLAPGSYRVEAWGRPDTGGEYKRYFTRDFSVDSAVPVVEFYSATLDHYFMSAGPDEIAALDRGVMGDWKRTSLTMKAWFRQADAPPTAVPVCRFYARGPNSHFYTGSADECAYLKSLEQQQRADAAARGQQFVGWGYEGTAFWAVMPQNGTCPGAMLPVYRAYNNRSAQNDSNHRFMVNAAQRAAMSQGWVDEGVHFCSAG